jgi:hypothetical protein
VHQLQGFSARTPELSASTVNRLSEAWQADCQRSSTRDLATAYDCLFASGVYPRVRLPDTRMALRSAGPLGHRWCTRRREKGAGRRHLALEMRGTAADGSARVVESTQDQLETSDPCEVMA